MNTQILEIRTTRTWLIQKIEVVQGDNGRILKCILVDFAIPKDATARLYALKPSGKEIYNNCTIEGNTTSTKLTTQITADVGIVECQIEVLSQSKEKVTSFKFDIEVKKSIASAASIESKDEYTALVESLASVEDLKRNGLKGDKGDRGETGLIGPIGPKGETGSVDNDAPIIFTETSDRQNITSGDTLPTLFGKIKKWFSDLKSAAFCSVVNNLTTNVEGSVLDARQGKVLSDTLNDNIDVIYDTNYGGTYNCPVYYNKRTKLLHVSLYLSGPIDNSSIISVLRDGIPTPSKNISIPFMIQHTDGTISTAGCYIMPDRNIRVYFHADKPATFLCLHGVAVIE